VRAVFHYRCLTYVYEVHSQVDVYVYQVNEFEKEALFRRVHNVYEEHHEGLNRITDVGYRLYYSADQHGQSHLWCSKGWLFVFRTLSKADQGPFIRKYLNATTAREEQNLQ